MQKLAGMKAHNALQRSMRRRYDLRTKGVTTRWTWFLELVDVIYAIHTIILDVQVLPVDVGAGIPNGPGAPGCPIEIAEIVCSFQLLLKLLIARQEGVALPLNQPQTHLLRVSRVGVDIQIRRGVKHAVHKLQCIRTGYERARSCLQGAKTDRVRDEATEMLVDVERALEEKGHGGARKTAGACEANERGRRKTAKDELENGGSIEHLDEIVMLVDRSPWLCRGLELGQSPFSRVVLSQHTRRWRHGEQQRRLFVFPGYTFHFQGGERAQR